MFFAPTLYILMKQDQISQMYVYNETVKFVDTIRNNGYVTTDLYERYLAALDQTNQVYQVEFEHIHEQFVPVVDSGLYLISGQYQLVQKKMYTKDIVSVLTEQESATYYFAKGDYLTIKVTNVNETLGGRMLRVFLRNQKEGGQINLSYGGMIRDENY